MKHKMNLEFNGSVLDLIIYLEGQEIRMFFDGKSKWTREIDQFEVDKNLDLIIFCKGINGTKWKFEIRVDDKGPKKYNGIIKKGISSVKDEIELPIT